MILEASLSILDDRVIVNPMSSRCGRPIALACLALVSGCGSRTGLLVGSAEEEPGAPQNTPQNSMQPPARTGDGGLSLRDALVAQDALPPIDVSVPPPNAMNDCPDAASTLVYVVSNGNLLMSFYPPTATFTVIGRISCPATAGFQPFSMAVDRTGIAYVLFADNMDTGGELFRVSTATASCRPTAFVSGQQGFAPTFGMAFVKDQAGAGETLYVAEGSPSATGSVACTSRLASIDTRTFALSTVGTLDRAVCSPELTGTGAGALFGFYALNLNDSAIGQIDPTTARRTSESRLAGVAQTDSSRQGAWAFGFWGGDFYTFTAPALGQSVITRFRPTDGSLTTVGRTTETIVGAGVSTCAPQQ
jgi:hypothetical protein